MANEPITREEILLNAFATGEAANLEPITREEKFLAKLGGSSADAPEPITRKEQFLAKAIDAMIGGNPGGAGGSTGCEILTGEVVWSDVGTSKDALDIEHNLGRMPKLFVIVPNSSMSREKNKMVGLFIVSTQERGMLGRYTPSHGISVYPEFNDYKIVNGVAGASTGVYANENKLTLATYLDSVFTVTAGDSYRWIIAG